MDMDHIRNVYFEECNDLLVTAEESLNALAESKDIEDLHAIFRSVHSIKGGAGSFGFKKLISFAHSFETVLDYMRDDKLDPQQHLDLMYRSQDVLSDLIALAYKSDLESEPEKMLEVLQMLNDLIGLDTSTNAAEKANEDHSKKMVVIEFKPYENMMRFGNEPFLIIKDLMQYAEDDTFQVQADFSDIPDIHDLVPDFAYIAWCFSFVTCATEKQLHEPFEFVEDDCELKINIKKQDQGANSTLPTGKNDLSTKKTAVNPGNDGKIMNQQDSNASKSEKAEQKTQSIRVELDRIDLLVNTVGEMVIKQAMVIDQFNGLSLSGQNEIVKGLRELTQHTRDLQESVMSIRAQPVKTVFMRMPRVVRELALSLNKDVRIETIGEGTEIDKTVIERLGEPLTHMIRNAVDHGIENPDEREAAGKPRQGTIKLSAEHKSGRIVIQISDDGQGINRERVKKIAIDKNLIPADANLTGEEIDNLIFMPGFSTAEKITDVSGRGVGMDVVKRSIQALGGRVSISSVAGKGSTFNLTLPLTLAVLDGMVVAVGKESFIIPTITIIETTRPSSDQISNMLNSNQILKLRQANIPLVSLSTIFKIDKAITDPTKGIVVVVETEGEELLGILVDDLLGQQQVVIKSLEDNYDPIQGISAATILGNGSISLILDISALREMHISMGKQPVKPGLIKNSNSLTIQEETNYAR